MRGKRQDLTGRRFGMLTVISREPTVKCYAYWRCLCDCGNETVTKASSLRTGNTTSCGCRKVSYRKEMEGKRFGRLVVTGRPVKMNGYTYWPCRCDCGTENYLVMGESLRGGNTTSCGCYRSEKSKQSMKWLHITRQSDTAASVKTQ